MSNETLLKMRSDKFRSLNLTAPSPGLTAGKLAALAGGLVGVAAEDAATGAEVGFIYQCDKIVVEKIATTAANVTQGSFVYYDDTEKKITGATATGRRKCGVALETAGPGTTEALIELDGTLGITAQTA